MSFRTKRTQKQHLEIGSLLPDRPISSLKNKFGLIQDWVSEKCVLTFLPDRQNEHQTDEFKKINPFSLVPVVDDDGFLLTESMAILKYVIGKYELGDHWFPRHNLKKQARVEEYLHWHQFNTRGMCASLFQQLLIIPKATGKPVNQEEVEKMRKKVSEVLKKLETYFLKTQTYIGGGNEISIADLFAVCELMQLYSCHEHSLYEKSPIIKAWMDRVKNDTNPYFDEAHKIIYRTFDVYKQISSKL